MNQPVDATEFALQRRGGLIEAIISAIGTGFGGNVLEGFEDIVDTREYQYDDPTFGTPRSGRPIYYTSMNDREDGKYLPIFQTEMDLAAIRAEARNITAMSGNVFGALTTMQNYTFGKGMKATVSKSTRCPTSIPDDVVAQWIQECQATIDTFLLQNNFQSALDREIDGRAREDGETFLELYLSPSGQIRVSIDEPDQIRTPYNTQALDDWLQEECPEMYSPEWLWSWSFGIHNIRRTPDDPMGYHVIYDQSGNDWEYVAAKRMVHFKRNVPRNVKRGVSDIYWIANDVLREAKIKRNTAEGAALQAAIAWIREHATGTTSGNVQTMLGGSTNQGTPPLKGTSPNKKGRLRFGTVVDIPASLQYKPGPMGAERNPNFILVAQYVARSVAARWGMPEFMYTSDASNGNYASTMVAESPFVKAREADQRFYAQGFVDLYWKVLRMAHEIGRILSAIPCERFSTLQQVLEITVEGPRVAVRDELQTVQRQAIEIGLGTLSEESAAAEMGRDLAKERMKGAKPATPDASQQALPFSGNVQQLQQLDAQGQPVPPPAPPGGEHVGMTLLQIDRINKATAKIVSAVKAGQLADTLGRAQLDALGWSQSKIDAFLDADPSNDPTTPDAITEAIQGEIETQSKPDSEFPSSIPTQDELVATAGAKMRLLISDLAEAVLEDDKPTQKRIMDQMEALHTSTTVAAGVLGLSAIFKGSILHAPSPGANDAPTAKSAVVTDEPPAKPEGE